MFHVVIIIKKNIVVTRTCILNYTTSTVAKMERKQLKFVYISVNV